MNSENTHDIGTEREPLRGCRALKTPAESTWNCGLHAPPCVAKPHAAKLGQTRTPAPPAGRRGCLSPSRQPSFQPLPLTDVRLSGYDTPAGAIASTSICISCSSRAAASCRAVSATCACDHR
eukprot:scaffold46488_cov57-Phaeocystis_antarctica.AAC.3